MNFFPLSLLFASQSKCYGLFLGKLCITGSMSDSSDDHENMAHVLGANTDPDIASAAGVVTKRKSTGGLPDPSSRAKSGKINER